ESQTSPRLRVSCGAFGRWKVETQRATLHSCRRLRRHKGRAYQARSRSLHGHPAIAARGTREAEWENRLLPESPVSRTRPARARPNGMAVSEAEQERQPGLCPALCSWFVIKFGRRK